MKLYLSTILVILAVASCSQSNPTVPKPRAYPRVERAIEPMRKHDFKDFGFQYSADANLVEKMQEKNGSFWFNMQYPEFKATLYCTYLQLGKDGFSKALKDNNRFLEKSATVEKHIQVYEEAYSNPSELSFGRLYYFEGNSIAPFQFYLTDSTHYFLRGSLYYDVVVNTDSVALTTESLREDIVKLIETFRYNPEN